jgi:hypothetical protein
MLKLRWFDALLYKIRAEVDSDVILLHDIPIETASGLSIRYVTEARRLTAVEVSTRVAINDFWTKVEPGEGRSVATLRFGVNAEIVDRFLQLLQRLEARLAFASNGAVRRINWNDYEEHWVAETQGEEAQIEIRRLSRRSDGYGTHRVEMPADIIVGLTAKSLDQHFLVGPMSIWQEAHADFEKMRYIQAFHGFYLVIEGLFAEGKSAEKEVMAKFLQSFLLVEATAKMMVPVRGDQRHWSNLLPLFQSEGIPSDTEEGVLRLMFRMRGHLRHYSISSRKPQPLPFDQRRYESLAWMSSGIAHACLLQLDAGTRTLAMKTVR